MNLRDFDASVNGHDVGVRLIVLLEDGAMGVPEYYDVAEYTLRHFVGGDWEDALQEVAYAER